MAVFNPDTLLDDPDKENSMSNYKNQFIYICYKKRSNLTVKLEHINF